MNLYTTRYPFIVTSVIMDRCITAVTTILTVAAVVLGQECRAGTAKEIGGNVSTPMELVDYTECTFLLL